MRNHQEERSAGTLQPEERPYGESQPCQGTARNGRGIRQGDESCPQAITQLAFAR